ncbi:MAG TPA: hemolysin family protein [Chryseosolibacter sp.]|nr:hemolysin family protein [Chryseosolibacter sp.]
MGDAALAVGMAVSLILSIFLSGIEVAFLSANKTEIELKGKQGHRSGKIMSFFMGRPTWFIGTTLIGNIAALLLFGIFTTLFVVSLFPSGMGSLSVTVLVPIVILTFILSVVILYTVEFFSKSFFIINSNRVLQALAIPFLFIFAPLFPLVFAVISLARVIVSKVFGLEYSKKKPVFGLTNVNHYLKSLRRKKPVDRDLDLDKKIFKNALEFKSVRIRDCMIPRTEIAAVRLDAGIAKLREAFLESGHSKIIVFKESIDDVVGYCHSSALFTKPSRIEDILTPIIVVPETTLARELMLRFINEHKSLAAVVDEFGGTSGIVSMEDVIEEIFGEIEDEHDEDTEIAQQLDKTTWLLSARLEIDYLNDTYGWKLPTGDYDTLSGLILSYTEDLPKQGETIEIPPFTFIVHDTEENRIKTVKVLMRDDSYRADDQSVK